MGLKTFKSYTKSTRGTVLVDRKNLKKAVDVLHKEFKLDY